MDREDSGSDDEIDEMRKFGSACLILASMKYDILEEDERIKLSILLKGKSKVPTKKHRTKSTRMPRTNNVDKAPPNSVLAPHHPVPQHPAPGKSIDGTLLPALPPIQALRNLIGICSPPFEKQITTSDVTDGQSRISLNKAFVEANYLRMLNARNADERLDKGVNVTTYGPDGTEYKMIFKFWCNKTYVINTGWKEFYKRYDLKACTHWTTIWMFRHRVTDRLCFALTWKVFPEIDRLIVSRNVKRKADQAV